MKFRLFNKIYAKLFGYFWLPCPICEQYFGGHEWLIGTFNFPSSIKGKGICPDCTRQGKGEHEVFTFDLDKLLKEKIK